MPPDSAESIANQLRLALKIIQAAVLVIEALHQLGEDAVHILRTHCDPGSWNSKGSHALAWGRAMRCALRSRWPAWIPAALRR